MRNFFDNNTERLYITYCYKSATTQEKMFENIQFPSVEWNQCLQLKSQQKKYHFGQYYNKVISHVF